MMRDRRRIQVLLLTLLLALTYATNAFAHAVVYPKRADTGAYEKYVLRVPNERDIATTRVEIRFPDAVKVVSFGDVAGWKLEVMTDSAKRIVGAVWTGNLPAQRFVELPFIAVNPATAATIVWPTYQTYADGEKVEWTGAEGSDKPASVTRIAMAAPAPDAGAAAVAPADGDSSDEGRSGSAGIPLGVAVLAFVVAMLALGLALRKRDA